MLKDRAETKAALITSKSRVGRTETGVASRLMRHVAKPMLSLMYRTWPATMNLKRYWDTFGRFPNVIAPKTFNERIQRKILFDRNPLLPIFADKLRAREYIRTKLGGDEHLTRLHGVVSSADEVARLVLPPKFVMKPNHLSGQIKVVWDSSTLHAGELENLAAAWLKKNFYDETQEWAYKNIKPRVMFEELLEVDGKVPWDYKFYCFDGEPRVFHVVKDRFGTIGVNVYDTAFNRLPLMMVGYSQFESELRPPPKFDGMIQIAKRLSKGIDFLRVDMYDVSGRIVCGELTNCPSVGTTRFAPPEWDGILGSYWK